MRSSARWQWKWTVRLRFEHLDERFEARCRARPSAPASLLAPCTSLWPSDELLALEGGDLHARDRGLLLVLAVALGVLAVGHLEAAEDRCRRTGR